MKTTQVYAPDPLNPRKFKFVGSLDTEPVKIFCLWCKSRYNSDSDNCPNCGGPYNG